jgi:hypothetical protein
VYGVFAMQVAAAARLQALTLPPRAVHASASAVTAARPCFLFALSPASFIAEAEEEVGEERHEGLRGERVMLEQARSFSSQPARASSLDHTGGALQQTLHLRAVLRSALAKTSSRAEPKGRC